MISLFKLLTAVICAAVFANAVPTSRSLPEVIPGPGLPSLASRFDFGRPLQSCSHCAVQILLLILTLPVGSEEMNSIGRRFPLMCGEVPPASAVADAVACFNFFNALTTKACTITGENGVFCQAGSCKWFGSNISGGPSVSSFCGDVATGGNVVINTCQGNGFLDGANAAAGNGNLIVTISEEA